MFFPMTSYTSTRKKTLEAVQFHTSLQLPPGKLVSYTLTNLKTRVAYRFRRSKGKHKRGTTKVRCIVHLTGLLDVGFDRSQSSLGDDLRGSKIGTQMEPLLFLLTRNTHFVILRREPEFVIFTSYQY